MRAAGDAVETGHATPLIEGKANGSSASLFPRAPIAGFAQDTPFSRASARTGNVPTPQNFGGTALNSNPSSGTAARLHRCSTIRMPAPSRIECTGRALPRVSSMFIERSEEHTSELQSLMRISYAVFCLKKKNIYAIHY